MTKTQELYGVLSTSKKLNPHYFTGVLQAIYGPGSSLVFQGRMSIETVDKSLSCEQELEGTKYIIRKASEEDKADSFRGSCKFFVKENSWKVDHDGEMGQILQGRLTEGDLVKISVDEK